MLKYFFTIATLALIPLTISAQFMLSGKITNNADNKALPGAHIVVQNTNISTVAGSEGYYEIKKLQTAKYGFTITYVGFKTQIIEVDLHKNTVLNIALKPTVIMSDEVIISAIRAGSNSPTTYSTMNRKEIAVNNTGKDLPYIINSTPSTVVSSDAGGGIGYTGLRIRGTDLTGINVTLNGVPVNDGESHSVYFVDLPDLASSINDIQIQRGVGTSTNGAASFGASINIKTGINSISPYAEVSSAAGSYGTFKNSLMFGTGLLADKWNFSARLSSIKSDGYINRASSNLKSAYFSGSYFGKKDIIKVVILTGTENT